MSRTDDELTAALNEAEGNQVNAEATEGVAAEPLTKSAEAPKRSLGLLIGVLVILAAVLTLVFMSGNNAAIYSMGVDEFMTKKEQLTTRNLRIDGKLVSGTLVKRTSPCEYRFKLEKNGSTLDVHYSQCVVPDTFRDVKGVDVMVTAEGKLAQDGHLAASQIFAKCPSKYEMKQTAQAAGMDPAKGMDAMLIPPKVVDN